MSKSERTQRRYKPAWTTQTYLDHYWEDEPLHVVQRTRSRVVSDAESEPDGTGFDAESEFDAATEVSSTLGEFNLTVNSVALI